MVNEISDESGPTTTHGNGDEGYGSIHITVIISLQQNSTMSSMILNTFGVKLMNLSFFQYMN